jgi:hypothetical protein
LADWTEDQKDAFVEHNEPWIRHKDTISGGSTSSSSGETLPPSACWALHEDKKRQAELRKVYPKGEVGVLNLIGEYA